MGPQTARSVGNLHETQIYLMAFHVGILCSKGSTQQFWVGHTLNFPKEGLALAMLLGGNFKALEIFSLVRVFV